MPKISAEASRERRANIVNAARRCFARNGIHISVDDICAEAGVSKGALYGYFPSKEAVIQAIADEHSSDLADIRGASTCEELVAALVAHIGNRSNCRLELEAWTYALNSPPLQDRLLANVAEVGSAIREAIGKIQENETPPADCARDESALLVETVAIGLVARNALGPGAETAKLLSLAVSKIMDR